MTIQDLLLSIVSGMHKISKPRSGKVLIKKILAKFYQKNLMKFYQKNPQGFISTKRKIQHS